MKVNNGPSLRGSVGVERGGVQEGEFGEERQGGVQSPRVLMQAAAGRGGVGGVGVGGCLGALTCWLLMAGGGGEGGGVTR